MLYVEEVASQENDSGCRSTYNLCTALPSKRAPLVAPHDFVSDVDLLARHNLEIAWVQCRARQSVVPLSGFPQLCRFKERGLLLVDIAISCVIRLEE